MVVNSNKIHITYLTGRKKVRVNLDTVFLLFLVGQGPSVLSVRDRVSFYIAFLLLTHLATCEGPHILLGGLVVDGHQGPNQDVPGYQGRLPIFLEISFDGGK